MADQVTFDSTFNKRLYSVDDNLDPTSITSISSKIVYYDGSNEVLVPVTPTVDEVSTGTYYVEFVVDRNNFVSGITYHVIVEGQSFGLPQSTELVSCAIVVSPDRPSFTVEFE